MDAEMTGLLRVGHLVARFLPATENWIHRLITCVPGVEPVVLNRGSVESTERFPVGLHVTLAGLSPAQCRREADAWEREAYSDRFLRETRRARCQVLHAHFGGEGALALPLARALGLPLVTSFYGFDAGQLPRDPAWRPALAALGREGTLFLAEGPAMAARLEEIGCARDRIRLVPIPAPDLPMGEPRAAAWPLVLICGRFVEKKGIPDSLRALAELRASGGLPFRAVVIGDGPDRDAIVGLRERLGLANCVELAGALPPDAVFRLIAAADVVLQMSRTAANGDCEGGAPVVLTDAMAAGIPVIGTRHCDIPWIVEDGTTGWIVPEGDWRQAAACLAEALRAPARRRRLGAAARARALGAWSRAASGERLRACYAEACRLGPPRRARRRIRVPTAIELVMDLRRRAGDVAGLERVQAVRTTPGIRRAAALALASVFGRRGAHARAAHCLGRACRIAPEPGLAFEEGKAWLKAGELHRAVPPLSRYVAIHGHRSFALSMLRSVLDTVPNGGVVFDAVLRRVGTPEERFAELVRRRGASGGARGSLARLTDAACRLSSRRQRLDPDRRRVVEIAVADLLRQAAAEPRAHAARRLRRLVRRQIPGDGLARYRMASALASGDSHDWAWSWKVFLAIEQDATLADDLRAGASFHLAVAAWRRGRADEAAPHVVACLSLNPHHESARRLLAEISDPERRAPARLARAV
jgi:colanic acid/amylovoran biosynthesis glycosyltransferase